MKRYLSIFNFQTVVILGLSLLSSYVSLMYQLSIYVDFLILNFIMIFPLTFSLSMAFRRRERALQYLSLFKASLQSVFYSLEASKLDKEKKKEFRSIVENISATLLKYLKGKSIDSTQVQEAAHSIFNFMQANKESIKRTFSVKIYLFFFRMNESIEFLLATHRHRTPWGPRAIVLFAIYIFVIFYPAALLHDAAGSTFWYMATMTASKGFILISFFNVQHLLENPFDQTGPDDIRMDDFKFLAGVAMAEELMTAVEITNEDQDSEILNEE